MSLLQILLIIAFIAFVYVVCSVIVPFLAIICIPFVLRLLDWITDKEEKKGEN